jgi:hypothetical protein
MAASDFHAICDALVGPFWGLAAGLGFQKVERETDGNDFLAGEVVSFVDRGVGGPDRAHFVTIEGALSRREGLVEMAIFSVGFTTFLRSPDIQEVRSIAAIIQPGSEIRFDSVLLWRLRAGGNDPVQACSGALGLEDLWALHCERVGADSGVGISEVDELGAFDRLHDELLEAQTARRS